MTLQPTPAGRVCQTYMRASRAAPRQARATVRNALASWGLSALSADAELLASELVGNASEEPSSSLIQLTIWPQVEPDGRRGIFCRVSDDSRTSRERRQQPDIYRGLGHQLVAKLAASSGVTANRNGKTAWFTLTSAEPDRTPDTRHYRVRAFAERSELEREAGQ